VNNASAICDDDVDGFIDEDPDCVPLYRQYTNSQGQSGYTSMPLGICLVSLLITLEGDGDRDGCPDVDEMQTAPGSQMTGGLRDPNNFWDFFDTPAYFTGVRDGAIVGSDIFRVVDFFGLTGDPGGDPLSVPPFPPAYHTAFDRTPSEQGSMPWRSGPADGAISGVDINLVVTQFGHSCA
jgi:hypothetical protein